MLRGFTDSALGVSGWTQTNDGAVAAPCLSQLGDGYIFCYLLRMRPGRLRPNRGEPMSEQRCLGRNVSMAPVERFELPAKRLEIFCSSAELNGLMAEGQGLEL